MRNRLIAPVAVLAAMLMWGGASAQRGGGGGGGGGGGEPEIVGNNLSYPAGLTAGIPSSFSWAIPAGGGVLGVNYSYGCAIPVDEFPNTSCITADGVWLTAAECALTLCAASTDGIFRIYWQKVSTNDWSADAVVFQAPLIATHVDWGDNLESVSWSASSIIRVETTPFTTMPELTTLTGLQMWHVSGKGTDEQWGVRATDDTLQPWVYESPYATVYTTTARFNAAKLGSAAVACPTEAGGTPPVVPAAWGTEADANTWAGNDVTEVVDVPYTAELNVGGKYVHGYNWNMKRLVMPVGVLKAGWWRLTFYTTDDIVPFLAGALTTPPTLPAAAPLVPLAVAEEEGDTGPLYAVVVDPVNQLTYIDICITAAKGSGGGGSR